jgi:hypothetical protein
MTTYQLFQDPPVNILLIIAYALCLVFFISFLSTITFASLKLVATFCILSLATGVLALGLSVHERSKMNESDEIHKTVATDNLKLKYDIRNADWNSLDTTAAPKDVSGGNNLIIEGNDGKTYVFKYKVNLQTGEPTLGDMPIAGGSSPQDAVTAVSLLKNK